ncbi:MAG: protease modulator HflK [Planctomycetota bacterium]|jgi:membrane protease subunit HflK
MIEENRQDNKDLQSQSPEKPAGKELDAASKAFSEALRISFGILKVIMVVLIIVFFVSGFRTVGSDEQALVLRFGKIRGVGENRLLGPGLRWVFPYPIDEIVKIPVEKRVNLAINSFWYFQKPSEILREQQRVRVPRELYPLKDGYCLTRGELQSQAVTSHAGSDYNIIHSKWQLTYKIDDPERFFRNVYVEDIKPGEIYFDVIKKNITPVLQTLLEDAVVTALVNYTIDEALRSPERIPSHVKRLLQEKLDKIDSGIVVISVQLNDITWPRQVDRAFQASIAASQARQQAISEAKLYAEKKLNEAGGPVAQKFLAALEDDTISANEKELLWSQLAGQAKGKIAEARAYRTQVVETARATVEYLKQILPEYRKRPKLVIQEIYQNAMEEVFNNADEKFIIQPVEGTKGTQYWIYLNRDPTIQSESEQEQSK